MDKKVLMVYASTRGITETAPGMVMLNLQRRSRLDIEIVCNGLRPVPESTHKITGLVPGTLTKLITHILSLFPYGTKKDWFMTSDMDTIRYYVEVMRYLRKLKPTIAIVHVSYTVTWLIKWVYRRTEVVYYHHGGNMHVKLTDKQWERLVKACPQLIISVTQFAIDGCRVKYKKLPDKMANIHNGIEINNNGLDPISKIKIWDSNDVFVFCYAGHFVFSKGLHIILSAFKSVSEKHPKARLLLIGDWTDKRESRIDVLLAVYNKLPNVVKKKIYITGIVSNTVAQEYIKTADAAILASQQTEGLSLFALEAMNCGLPIIMTGVGGNSELNDPAIPCCLFFNPLDDQIDQLTQLMRRLQVDDIERISLSKNALKRAKDHFALNRMINQFDEVIEPLLSR